GQPARGVRAAEEIPRRVAIIASRDRDEVLPAGDLIGLGKGRRGGSLPGAGKKAEADKEQEWEEKGYRGISSHGFDLPARCGSSVPTDRRTIPQRASGAQERSPRRPKTPCLVDPPTWP